MSRRKQWGLDSKVYVDLSAGASVELIFKGNLFELSEEERALIGSLSCVIQKYKDDLLAALAPEDVPTLEVQLGRHV